MDKLFDTVLELSWQAGLIALAGVEGGGGGRGKGRVFYNSDAAGE